MRTRQLLVLLACVLALLIIGSASTLSHVSAATSPRLTVVDQWIIETVDDTGEVGYGVSLAVDANGVAHVAYYDYTLEDLKYAYRDLAGWHIEIVDRAGNVGGDPSIALDPAGKPAISYYDFTNHQLKVAYRIARRWRTMAIAPQQGGISELAIAPNGAIHILYSDGYSLRYARKMPGQLPIIETLVEGWFEAGSGAHTAAERLVLDGNGTPHISYIVRHALDYSFWDTVDYAVWLNETWETQEAYFAPGLRSIYNQDLAVDSQREPHLMVCQGVQLINMSRFDNNWTATALAAPHGCDPLAFALDSRDLGHVVLPAPIGSFVYGEQTADGWQFSTVAFDGGFRDFADLAVSSRDDVYISFYDGYYGTLKFALHR